MISKNLFSDIMKSFFEIANSKSWYQNMIFWSHRIDYLISRIKVFFFRSRKRILDIRKSFFYIPKNWIDIKIIFIWKKKNHLHFLISENRFLDIRKNILAYSIRKIISKFFTLLQINLICLLLCILKKITRFPNLKKILNG